MSHGLDTCAFVAALLGTTAVSCMDQVIEPFDKVDTRLACQSSADCGIGQTCLSECGLCSVGPRSVDILFVVDNSNSMCEEQMRLRRAFGAFVEVLAAARTDFRIALVTTDVIDLSTGAGQFRRGPGTYDEATDCAADLPELDDTGHPAFCSRKKLSGILSAADYHGSDGSFDAERLQEDFACLALAGVDGSPLEMGLAAMSDALTRPGQTDFLRAGSILSVLFVTDDNDCSDRPLGTSVPGFIEPLANADKQCEYSRNIEDSCLFLGDEGPEITYNGITRSARQWCVLAERAALEANIEALGESVKCNPDSGCSNRLVSRAEYLDNLLSLVATRNGYVGADGWPDRGRARDDVFVAAIINQDGGVRFNDTEVVHFLWCHGTPGTQGYRYQLFAEMFPANHRVIAPICDMETGNPEDLAGPLRLSAERIVELTLGGCPPVELY